MLKEYRNINNNLDNTFLLSNILTESKIKRNLKEMLKDIFLLNNFKISEKTINKYFTNFLDFLTFSLKDNVIKSNKDLKYAIEHELLLTIENEQYLFDRFFNNKYHEIKNFLFLEII